jgi:hypothetical protein
MDAGIAAAGSWAVGGNRIRLAFGAREISGRRIRKTPRGGPWVQLQPMANQKGASVISAQVILRFPHD